MPALMWSLVATFFVLFTLIPFALLRARHAIGITPLWIFAGGALVFYYFTGSGFVILVGPFRFGLSSITILPSLISLSLLTYITSGITETRRFFLALVGLNLLLASVFALYFALLPTGISQRWAPPGSGINFLESLHLRPRTVLAGAFALLIDLFVISIVYQWLTNHTRLPLTPRAILALAVTLNIDTLVFLPLAFWQEPWLAGAMRGLVIGKSVVAVVHGLLIGAYRLFVEPETPADRRGTLDILKYEQKIEEAQRRLKSSEERYRRLFEDVMDAIVVVSRNRIFDLNRRAEMLFGMSRDSLLNSSTSALGLPATTAQFERATLDLPGGRKVHVEAAGTDMELEGVPARMVTLRDVSEQAKAQEVIKRKNEELEALNAVAGTAIRNAPAQEILADVVKKIETLTGTDSCAINLVDETGGLSMVAASGVSEETRLRSRGVKSGLVWNVFQSGQMLIENDVPSRTDARRDLIEGGVTLHATIAAPIVSRGRVIGTLATCSYRPRTFTAEEGALLATLGAQLGSVIDNAQLIEDIRTQKEISEILVAAATAFARARGIGELSDSLLDAVTWASGLESVAFLLYDPDRDLGTIVAIAGVPDEARPLLLGRSFGPANVVFRRLIETRETIILTEAELRLLTPKDIAEKMDMSINMIMVPLFQAQGFLGTISVNFSPTQGPPSARTLAILDGLAGLCGTALSNLRLRDVAERRALLSASLLAMGQEVARELDPVRITRFAASQARKLLVADAAAVLVASPSGFKVEGEDSSLNKVEGRVFEAFGKRMGQDRGIMTAVDTKESGDCEVPAAQEARAWLCVPMTLGDRVVGAVCVSSREPRKFSAEDATALSSLATYAAASLENARLLDDLRISNEEIRNAQEQVVRNESLAAIGRLSASIAHEIRNPLSGISAAAQALLRVASSESASNVQLLKIIDRESKRLNRIITDFLHFARPRTPAFRRVVVPALVDSTLMLVEGDVGGKVKVTREHAPEVPEIQADGDQVKQVLLNLLVNAVQSMPEGGQIDVRSRLADLEGEPAVEITVGDTGPGIPPSDLSRVFEPFYSTRKEGTGLGLAIAHQIVSAHRGTITAHAAGTGGALFRVVLPIAQAAVRPVKA